MLRAFTLVELLVVIAVMGLLISMLLPALARARDSGRQTACLANQRQIFTICRVYADENKGIGPALGAPYAAPPNWALVVQLASGLNGSTSADLYSERSVVVCPSIRAFYALPMLRTYAMNATGHAGILPDPDNYDDPNWASLVYGGQPREAHINFDRVVFPGDTDLLVDSSAGHIASGAPPPTRTASILDFRQRDQLADRLGVFHASRFNAVLLDGSARSFAFPPSDWLSPLP